MTREELIDMIIDHSAGATDNVADGVCFKTLADSILKCLSLPPAEGAEEIFRECFAEEAVSRGDTPLSDEKWNDLVKESGGFMFRAMERFATLHAQRIADKMVSERLREELIHYTEHEWSYTPEFCIEIVDEYLKTREK